MVRITVTPMAIIRLTARGKTGVVAGLVGGGGETVFTGGVGVGVGDRAETVTEGYTQSASERMYRV